MQAVGTWLHWYPLIPPPMSMLQPAAMSTLQPAAMSMLQPAAMNSYSQRP